MREGVIFLHAVLRELHGTVHVVDLRCGHARADETGNVQVELDAEVQAY